VLGVDHQAATTDRLIPDAATIAGKLWEPWLVEGLAQTAGILNGMNERTTGGTSRKGMLVGVRRLKFHRRPTVGETVRFHVELVKRLGPLTLIDGRVTAGDDLIAAGEMKFYVEVE
jgi:3-hydroxymyristoyl/3-hydroxydecanoyl-(acyl carrier protein) dehydratase